MPRGWLRSAGGGRPAPEDLVPGRPAGSGSCRWGCCRGWGGGASASPAPAGGAGAGGARPWGPARAPTPLQARALLPAPRARDLGELSRGPRCRWESGSGPRRRGEWEQLPGFRGCGAAQGKVRPVWGRGWRRQAVEWPGLALPTGLLAGSCPLSPQVFPQCQCQLEGRGRVRTPSSGPASWPSPWPRASRGQVVLWPEGGVPLCSLGEEGGSR